MCPGRTSRHSTSRSTRRFTVCPARHSRDSSSTRTKIDQDAGRRALSGHAAQARSPRQLPLPRVDARPIRARCRQVRVRRGRRRSVRSFIFQSLRSSTAYKTTAEATKGPNTRTCSAYTTSSSRITRFSSPSSKPPMTSSRCRSRPG